MSLDSRRTLETSHRVEKKFLAPSDWVNNYSKLDEELRKSGYTKNEFTRPGGAKHYVYVNRPAGHTVVVDTSADGRVTNLQSITMRAVFPRFRG